MENNRLGQASPVVVKFITASLKAKKKQVKTLDGLIAEGVHADTASKDKVAIMQSVKGLGPVAISTLVTELPELSRVNRGQIAKLVGIAPINDDSGQHQGKRQTGAGRVRFDGYSTCRHWWRRATILVSELSTSD